MGYRKFPYALGIKAKLIIGVMGVHIVLMTLFVMDIVQRQQDYLLQEVRNNSINMARLMASGASSWILAEDVGGLAEILLARYEGANISYACIVDASGLVLAHTDRELEGKYINDPESAALLSTSREARIWRDDATLFHTAAPVEMGQQLLGWVLLGVNPASTYAHLRAIRYDGVLYTLAAMLCGALAAWGLAVLMLRQLHLILRGVDRLRDSKLKTPIAIVSDDEIGHVAFALNEAMSSLRHSQEALEKEIQERSRAEQRIHQLSQRLMEGSEEERKRLGHDLHDELGQSVTGIIFALHSLRGMLDGDIAGARELSDKLLIYAEEMGDTVSRIATHSWPIALEHLGLPVAAESYVEECDRRSPLLNLCFHTTLPTTRLDARVELACYRILQEAVTNIMRHSGARNGEILLSQQKEWLVLRVQDDGCGFDVQHCLDNKVELCGIGLVGMNARAAAVGGHVVMRSAPGQGTVIKAYLPLLLKSPCVTEECHERVRAENTGSDCG